MNVGGHLLIPVRVQTFFWACFLAPSVLAGAPSLTIYNQNFSVVRDSVPLDLQPGTNLIRFDGCAAFLEPSSVVLRDPAAKHAFQILEQNFRYDSVSQEKLLELNEGKVISFELSSPESGQARREIVPGKIVRSGPMPLIEMNGSLRFGLPGQPLFPALGDNTILKPTLVWLVRAAAAARFDAELSYVTGEMQWEADYNLVLPTQGETLDLVGWITMDNQTGKSFENARIKLMAGDVNKIQRFPRRQVLAGGFGGGGAQAPPVVEKSFDEYHLYTLERPATLLDHEKKQVEFIRAGGVRSKALYVYDGASMEPDQPWPLQGVRTEPEYGTQENLKVWVFREFTNSAANQLGVPLPKGTLRLYRRDSDGQLEFTGESTIKHTPRDEPVRLFTGNSFDLVGRRRRTDFKSHISGVAVDPTTGLPVEPQKPIEPPSMDESFEITVRNHKRETVRVRVVEHLYRWSSWQIREPSQPFQKADAQTIEFLTELKPDAEQKISYTVHYWW
jgi:hypothetical protein